MVKKKKAPAAEIEIIDGQAMQQETLNIEYNQRTRQSYVDNGFISDMPSNLDLVERTFLSRVDTTGKYPIKRVVTRLVRLKWRNPDTRKEDEYLVYYENWYGKDYLGRRVSPVADHCEGLAYEVEKEPEISYTDKGPVRKGWKMIGKHKIFYIPFSKNKVDEIIEKADDTYRDELRYCVKFSETSRGDRFQYSQFILPWEEVYKLSNRKGGPTNPNPYLGGEDTLKAGVT